MKTHPALLVTLVRLLVLAGAAVLLILPPLFWSNPDWVRAAAPNIAGVDLSEATPAMRWRGLAGSVPMVLLGLYVLWSLWRLFGEFAAGRALGRPALRGLRRFAWALLAAALAQPLAGALMSVLLTWDRAAGQRQLVLSFGWHDYMAVLLAMVLLAIAQVMHGAVAAAEENQGFV
jgi:hypothetical protein